MRAAGEGGRVTAVIVVLFRRGRGTVRVAAASMQCCLPVEKMQ